MPVQEQSKKGKRREILISESNCSAQDMKVTQINRPNMRPTLNSRGNYVRRTVCGSPDQLIHTTFKKESNDPSSNFMAERAKIMQAQIGFTTSCTSRLDIRKLAQDRVETSVRNQKLKLKQMEQEKEQALKDEKLSKLITEPKFRDLPDDDLNSMVQAIKDRIENVREQTVINTGGAKQSVINKLMKEQRDKAKVAHGPGEKQILRKLEF